MSLAKLLKKGGLRLVATAVPATFATDASSALPKVATVAPVAVANAGKLAANNLEPTATTVQASVMAGGAVVDIGTIRPPGLTPKCLAASLALDAAIVAAGLCHIHDPDADCWPHSTGMNSAEIDQLAERLQRFTDKGLSDI